MNFEIQECYTLRNSVNCNFYAIRKCQLREKKEVEDSIQELSKLILQMFYFLKIIRNVREYIESLILRKLRKKKILGKLFHLQLNSNCHFEFIFLDQKSYLLICFLKVRLHPSYINLLLLEFYLTFKASSFILSRQYCQFCSN